MCTYAEERAVEVADGEELPDIAAGDGAAAEARAADDGEARGGELEQGLELGCLLGGALAEEAHDFLPAERRLRTGWVLWRRAGDALSLLPPTLYTGLRIGALRGRKPDLLVDYGVCSGRANIVLRGCAAVLLLWELGTLQVCTVDFWSSLASESPYFGNMFFKMKNF